MKILNNLNNYFSGELTTIVVKTWSQKLGEEIAKARRRARITQEELHRAIGLSRNSIGLYERGERAPDFDVLRKIATALSADAFEIDDGLRVVFTRTGEVPRPNVQTQQLVLNFDTD